MSILIVDEPPTDLTPTRDGQNPLELHVQHEGQTKKLSDHDNILLLGRDDKPTMELRALDFEHQGTTYQVHAWPELPGGGFSDPWPRGSDHVSSGAHSDLDVVVLFVTVAQGMTVTTPDPLEGPPGPDQAVVEVKIGPKGSMPVP